jgi:Glyoxalase/Bleomycin resistance protein/Dioxygenase superfamily
MDDPVLPVVALDHVGIVAPDPDSPLAALLAAAGREGRAMKSGVTVARFGPGGALELVWPGRPGTPVDGFLARRGPGLHHIALRVDEPLADLREGLLASGIEVIGMVDVSSDGRPCLFLHPRSTGGVLVELVEGAPFDNDAQTVGPGASRAARPPRGF